MKIGIPKERREHELRAAGSADTVKRYKGLGLEPVVERGAGTGAAILDQAFADAGATLVDDPAEVWASEIVLKVQRPDARRRWAGCGRARSWSACSTRT